ncbi:MAG TPA: DUF5996 family protein [Xanthobacteraceae bacterium]|nr:DUF5996 family protein [Xanthobacteraceae bacterium]
MIACENFAEPAHLVIIRSNRDAWPELAYTAWKDTCETLHLWTQIAGKVRLALAPWLNHSWQVPLYVTARGLTTSPIYDGPRSFELVFDFSKHVLELITSDGHRDGIALRPQTVATFYATVMAALHAAGIRVEINELPSEIPGAIPFSRDTVHATYDPDYAHRFWRALAQADRVFKEFRTGFIGKASPVHFFWGSFDLAVTRFSGRRAPPHPGGVPGLSDKVVREAYSHEVSSAGFWPGGAGIDYAAFYSYAYPEPAGFRTARIEPAQASFNETLGEFLLPYDAVRTAAEPDTVLLAFLNSTYEAAANAAKWDRAALECAPGVPGVPRP